MLGWLFVRPNVDPQQQQLLRKPSPVYAFELAITPIDFDRNVGVFIADEVRSVVTMALRTLGRQHSPLHHHHKYIKGGDRNPEHKYTIYII